MPDDAIVAADSGSAANWYARHCSFRGQRARFAVGHAGHDGPGRPVRDRREMGAPGPADHRAGRRRRDADERPRRADHRRPLLAAVGRPAADRRRAAQQRPQPGHLGDAGHGRCAEVRRVPDPARRRLRRVRAQPRAATASTSTTPTTRPGLGRRRCPRTGPPCSTSAATRTCRRSRRTRPSSRSRRWPARCWHGDEDTWGFVKQGLKQKVQQYLPGSGKDAADDRPCDCPTPGDPPARHAARRVPNSPRWRPICASGWTARCASTRAPRGAYSTDGSNFRQVPIAVVVPRTVDAGAEAIAVCREHGAPVVSRGGGTSLAGQCTNTAVMIDWAKYCHRLVSVDVDAQTCVVEPGIVLDVLNAQLEQHGLRYGPEPATHPNCTLGGMIGNNSLRRHRAAHRQGRRQPRPPRGAALRRHPVLVRSRPTTTSTSRSSGAATGKRASTGSCGRCATPTPTRSAPASRTSRAGCPATTWTRCCPSTASTSPACSSARSRRWSRCCSAELELVPVVQTPRPGGARLPFDHDGGRRGAGDPAARPDRARGPGPPAHPRPADQGPQRRRAGRTAAPADGYLMVQFGGDTQARGRPACPRDGRRRSATVRSRPGRRRSSTTRATRTSCGRSARPASAPPPTSPTNPTPGRDGRTPPSTRTGSVTTCATWRSSTSSSATPTSRAPSLYGHFGQGCVHTRIPFRLTTADGVADLPPLPRTGGRPGRVLRRLAVRRAR